MHTTIILSLIFLSFISLSSEEINYNSPFCVLYHPRYVSRIQKSRAIHRPSKLSALYLLSSDYPFAPRLSLFHQLIPTMPSFLSMLCRFVVIIFAIASSAGTFVRFKMLKPLLWNYLIWLLQNKVELQAFFADYLFIAWNPVQTRPEEVSYLFSLNQVPFFYLLYVY